MKRSSLRAAMLVAALVVACSSAEDDDAGCGPRIGERPCKVTSDCEGFTPLDLTVLGPQQHANCFEVACVSELCEATPRPGVVVDETRGDCTKFVCNEYGRLERAPNRSDAPSSKDVGPCQRKVCEDGVIGMVARTTDLPEGASCTVGSTAGICVGGSCVVAGEDSGADAGEDPDASDAGGEADADAPTDAAAD